MDGVIGRGRIKRNNQTFESFHAPDAISLSCPSKREDEPVDIAYESYCSLEAFSDVHLAYVQPKGRL